MKFWLHLVLETVEELVGRTDLLQRSTQLKPNSKAASLQIERLIEQFDGVNTKEISQNHHLDEGFDLNYLYPDARYSIENGHFLPEIMLLIMNSEM